MVGTAFRRINEKLGAETGDLAMTYKLVVAVVVLRRCAVRIGGGFSWEWSNGNELWDLVVVRNLFARCGSSRLQLCDNNLSTAREGVLR